MVRHVQEQSKQHPEADLQGKDSNKYVMLDSRESDSLNGNQKASTCTKLGYWMLIIGVVGLRFPFGGYLAITGGGLYYRLYRLFSLAFARDWFLY